LRFRLAFAKFSALRRGVTGLPRCGVPPVLWSSPVDVERGPLAAPRVGCREVDLENGWNGTEFDWEGNGNDVQRYTARLRTYDCSIAILMRCRSGCCFCRVRTSVVVDQAPTSRSDHLAKWSDHMYIYDHHTHRYTHHEEHVRQRARPHKNQLKSSGAVPRS
jgi:hypothetical protein